MKIKISIISSASFRLGTGRSLLNMNGADVILSALSEGDGVLLNLSGKDLGERYIEFDRVCCQAP